MLKEAASRRGTETDEMFSDDASKRSAAVLMLLVRCGPRANGSSPYVSARFVGVRDT
jgi:hypothetical protein